MPPVVGDSVYTALINGFASNPAMLLLAVVLVGLGFLAYKFSLRFLDANDKVAESIEKISETLEAVREDVHDLKKDIAVIAERVSAHEVRINRLERP